jgi:hypothetical protein
VNGKKLLVLGLALVFVLGSLFMVACGGDDTAAKDAMKTALTKINADIAALTSQFMAGGTEADLKTAKTAIAPDWQAVVDAAKNVKGADPVKAQQVWDDVAAAIDSLPAGADLTTIAGAVMGPVTALQAYVAELGKLVGLEATATTLAAPPATAAPAAAAPAAATTTTVAQ